LHSRRCPGDFNHRPLWLSQVVANSRTHPVLVGWFCIAQLVDGHPIRDTMAWCKRSFAPRHGANGRLHSRRFPEDGHHQPLWLSRVVAHSRTHPVAAAWTFIVLLFNGLPTWDNMAWCKRSIELARMRLGWSPSTSLAFAGGSQLADAPGGGGVHLYRLIVRWPPNRGREGVVQEIHCTRADVLRLVTIDRSGVRGWSPTRGSTKLQRGGSELPNWSMAPQLGRPLRGARGRSHSRGRPVDGRSRHIWLSRVAAN